MYCILLSASLFFAAPCDIIRMVIYGRSARKRRLMEKHGELNGKLFISTTADDCREAALRGGVGLEIAEFCWAQRIDLDLEKNVARCRELMEGLPRFIFHAPFAELAPCAIDPRARELAASRYRQSVRLAERLGTKRIVIHGGFIPEVYFPEYYVSESIHFWKRFLRDAPDDIEIMLENVMEPSPDTLVRIADGVGDPRLGLCLDVGHANCSVSQTPPLEWIEPMRPHLRHVHIHNNEGDRDLHSPLGSGTIPMEQVLDTVLEACPRASFTVENIHCRESMDWLADKGYLK